MSLFRKAWAAAVSSFLMAVSTTAHATDIQAIYGTLETPDDRFGKVIVNYTGIGFSYHITEHFSITNQVVGGPHDKRHGFTVPVEVAPGIYQMIPAELDIGVDWGHQLAVLYGYRVIPELEILFSFKNLNGSLDTDLGDVKIRKTYFGLGLSYEPGWGQKIGMSYEKSENDSMNVVTAFYEKEFDESWGFRGLFGYYPTEHTDAGFQIQIFKNL